MVWLVLFSIYLTMMVVAMYPGRGPAHTDPDGLDDWGEPRDPWAWAERCAAPRRHDLGGWLAPATRRTGVDDAHVRAM